MHRMLLRLWDLPWPQVVRPWFEQIVKVPWVQRLIIPQFSVGVVGVIENERGELLLLRHTYRRGHPWGLPSGFVEHGEQPADALKREIQEEAGFCVDLSPIRDVYVDERRPLVNIVFAGRYRSGDFVSSSEVSAARFFPRDRLPVLMPDQLRLVERYTAEEVSD